MADKSSEKRNSDSCIKKALHLFYENPLLVSALVILIITAASYGGSTANGFVWDDETFIVNNKFVHNLSLLPQYFTNPRSVSSEPVLSRMYRPMQTLSFALDAYVWDSKAGGFHLTSLLLHVGACIAVIFAFRDLIGIKPAAAGAFIFAAHPALSEGVLSLASRGNQLYTLFGLLSIGLFIRTKHLFDRSHFFSILTAFLALFSKEPAIAVIAILPIIQLAFKKPWPFMDRRSFMLYIPFTAAAVFYLAVRSRVVITESALPFWGGSIWATLQMQAKVFVIYLRLLFWPFILKGRYSIDAPASFPDPYVTGAILINAAIIISGIIAVRHKYAGKLFSISVAWFYISLAPVSNLFPLPGSMMGERFLYFTFAGIIPLLAGTFQNTGSEKFKRALLVIGIIIFAAWLTTDIKRTAVWKNNMSFFSVLSRQEPDNPAVQIRMAQEELASDDAISAMSRLERIMKFENTAPLPEDRARLHYWYGKSLLEAGRPREAFREFSIVAGLKPDSSRDIALLLAESAARSGDFKTARSILEKEIKSSPKNDAVWNALGNIFMMTGDTIAAQSSYKKALEINPGNTEAAINLRNAFRAKPSSDSP